MLAIKKKYIDRSIYILSFGISALALYFISSTMRIKSDFEKLKKDVHLASTMSVNEPSPHTTEFGVWVAANNEISDVTAQLIKNSATDINYKSFVLEQLAKPTSTVYYLSSHGYGSVFSRNTGSKQSLDSLLIIASRAVNLNQQSLLITDFATSSLIESTKKQDSNFDVRRINTIVGRKDNVAFYIQ